MLTTIGNRAGVPAPNAVESKTINKQRTAFVFNNTENPVKHQQKPRFIKFSAASVRHFLKVANSTNVFLIAGSEIARKAMQGGLTQWNPRHS